MRILTKTGCLLSILACLFSVRGWGQQLTVVVTGPGSICQGTSAEFTANITTGYIPSEDYVYQWLVNGRPYGSQINNAYTSISGLNNGDKVACEAQELANGTVNGTSNPITVSIYQPPVFSVSIYPSSLVVCQGSLVTYTAVASTSATFSWRAAPNSVSFPGGNTLTVAAQDATQLQDVEVSATATTTCVTNSTASATAASSNFTVMPLTYPSLSLSQSTSPVLDGNPVTFTATPTGQGNNPTYQWEIDGFTVSGVSGPTYTPTITSGSDVQNVSVSMTSTGTCPQNAAVANTSFQVVSSDWENQNYIRVQDILVSGVSNFFGVDGLPIGQKRERTTYLDGLGRPIQKLDKSGSLVSGTSTDLVVPVSYDPAGRSTQQFLPYTTSDNPGKFKSVNVATEQAAFVTNKFNEPSSAPTYSQTSYDNSPLNRVMAVFAPGASWGGNNIGIHYSYDFNNVSEDVHIWTLAYTAGAIPSTTASSWYATGSLYKKTTTDEKGKQLIIYVDLTGDTILKKVQLADPPSLTGQHAGWACTYYVYDDRNQLRFILTPNLVDYLDNNGWGLTQQLVNDLAFVYTYDGKGRQISKKQPGIGETDVVYDERDRPVFMQDALGQSNTQWQSITYDALDRQTATGMMLANIATSVLQTDVNGSTGNLTTNGNAGLPGYLDVSGTETGTTQYVAANSIVFEGTFTSTGTFTATVTPGPQPIVPEVVAIPDNPVPSGNTVTLLTQTFYDDYSQGSKTYTTADNSLFDPSTNQQALPLPSQYDPQTRGHITVSKVKVITTPTDLTQGNWLETDNFYDNQGRVVQIQNDNGLGGTDVVTNRYDFAGKLWGSCVKHMAGSPTQFTVVSRNNYDNLGRLVDVSKNFNSTFFKDLASYTYDEYGKLTAKILAPGYTGSGKTSMETLNYSYNIQGWLTGINQAYALDQNIYDQWNDFFGIYLGYDNRDDQFNAAQYNGSITGAIWKSQGDNSMRRYDYSYDNMGRLTAAAFLQRATPADNWLNSAVDLSEVISYADKNGNIQTMQRKGLVPGMTGGVQIDNLAYTYGTTADPNSNQLMRVDELASFSGNGQLNDFKDGSNAAGTPDYAYDVNGNLSQDQNKGITSIAYNYLNKPYSVTIAGKMTIAYTYDATGTKLTKTVTDLTVTPNVTTTTSYDDEFVYQNNVLQYVLHEEGRLNIITPINTPQQVLNAGSNGANVISGKQGVFEYFVKDQLSNVRMVLTEESQTENYIATMETSSSADPNLGTDEAKLFGEVDPSTGNPTADNEVNLTRTATGNTPWSGNTSAEVSQLSAAAGNPTIGPNMLLKVSAGDIINAGVNYFYFTNSPAGPTYAGSDVVTALLGALAGSHLSPLAEGNNGLISTNMNASGGDFLNFINTYVNSSSSSAPKAYLNVLFFDEQFNFIPPDPNNIGVGTGLVQVNSPNNQNASPLTLGQKAPKNGWVYIYISNESNQDVYFDNLSISQVHGNISEEDHYYSFGQKIAGICTVAFNKLQSQYRYQGDYSEEEDNTQWNEFDLRMYDPQIGRWTGADPYDQFASPYVGMGNDPVNSVDPDGGGVDWGLGEDLGTSLGGVVGGIAGYFIAKNNPISKNKAVDDAEIVASTLLGGVVGAGVGYGIGGWLDNIVYSSHGSPITYTAAFYRSLLGITGYTHFGLDIFKTGASVDNPDIWGALANVSISIPSINLPPLATWVDDFQRIWTVIDIKNMVSEDYPNKQATDNIMKRTIHDNTDPDDYFKDIDAHDEGTVEVPYGDDTRTDFSQEGYYDVGPNARQITAQQNGPKFTVFVDQHGKPGHGDHYTNNDFTHGVITRGATFKPSKIVITTFRRIAKPIKRLKFLGIRLPFTRK